MSFSALTFIFDGISSESKGLYLFSTNSKETNIDGGAKLKLHTDKTNISYKHNLLGVSEDDALKFNLAFGSLEPLSRYDISSIQRWLFGHREYKKLQIMQEDMLGVHYNCILTEPKITTIGNVPYMFECKVVCDSPFAWENKATYEYVLNGTQKTITHINTSDVNDYTYPIIEFDSAIANNTISLVNLSNDNRDTRIENLASGEKITLNNENQIIESSTNLNRLGQFNKNWFELVPGENQIKVSGNVGALKIRYANARRIGG